MRALTTRGGNGDKCQERQSTSSGLADDIISGDPRLLNGLSTIRKTRLFAAWHWFADRKGPVNLPGVPGGSVSYFATCDVRCSIEMTALGSDWHSEAETSTLIARLARELSHACVPQPQASRIRQQQWRVLAGAGPCAN